jgi:hypothetical protein
MNEQTLITYKYYDKKGRRLAIFGVPLAEYKTGVPTQNTALKIIAIACSAKDTFSKKKAKELYKAYVTGNTKDVHPTVTILEGITDGNFKRAFMIYCNTHFQKPVSWVRRFSISAVKNGRKTRILRNVNISNKLDAYSIE